MKRFLIVPLVGVLAALSIASAADLNGITGPNIASADDTVASCDPDGVTVAYTTAYNAGLGTYVVNAITVSGIHGDCAGYDMTITLTDPLDAEISSETQLGISSPSQVVAFSPVVPVVDIEGIHILIVE